METPAAIVVRDNKFKGLLPTGFTVMVSRIFFSFNQKIGGFGFQTFPAVKVHIQVVYLASTCLYAPSLSSLSLSLS
jgi:hypothetical protein